MFSGFLQAAAYKGLNGTNGLSGWRSVPSLLTRSMLKYTSAGCSLSMGILPQPVSFTTLLTL